MDIFMPIKAILELGITYASQNIYPGIYFCTGFTGRNKCQGKYFAGRR